VQVPCGQCIGCRLERSRQWAIRCVHEAQLHEDNSFITLTYNNENLPPDGSLRLKDFQDFMKRLRARTGVRIRFFHCGEYGPKFGRPHYHACLFGYDFPDRVYFKTVNKSRLYTSELLSSLWPVGFSTVGDVTFESAAYVARYIMKKVTGAKAEDHYWKIDEMTGEVSEVRPEYTTMSRRPGLASEWYEQFHDDVYPDDFVVLRGNTYRPPKFYDRRFEIADPDQYAALKERRQESMRKHHANNTPERLAVREKVKRAQIAQLKRGYEDEA